MIGYLLQDCAFAVTEWCRDTEGNFRSDWVEIFLSTYSCYRPLLSNEKKKFMGCIALVYLRSIGWIFEPDHWFDTRINEYRDNFVKPILNQILAHYTTLR